MAWFVLALLLLALGVGALRFARTRPTTTKEVTKKGTTRQVTVDKARLPRLVGFAALAFGALAFLPSVLYSQAAGQANVIVNIGGAVAGVDVTTGISVKAPWQSRSTWDLLSQTATYAGTGDGTPAYTDGNIQGREITVSLGRVQPNVDAQVSYSLQADPEKIRTLYNRYRTQENFTRQVVQPVILSTMREAPSNVRPDEQEPVQVVDGEEVVEQVPGVLTPVQFRGEYRDDVEREILDGLNEDFSDYGVVVERVELQDIRFSEQVEASLDAVEAAQQRVQEAEANLEATRIEAQAQVVQAEQAAAAAIAEANGQAEANRLLAASLTPEIIESRRIEALREAGAVYVVPEGSTPLVTVQQP
ncbi:MULTISPECIES: SPFH domain-containing protein [unclassified Actinotalea]|uniref:SPFH domain-containing protein n=1 Tax=unclassified Actinotalea TaxID=2638618 RepID=UPI0015F4BCDE|nr:MULTISPECIES: SPFH domain-containing protein [unclassified Actinotalea]